jgi:farnesyl diphosphate synthase
MVSYGLHLGRAFQAIDDILDMTSSTHILGKTLGKDVFQDKATLVKALGLEGAKAWAVDETGKAVSAIAGIPQGSVLMEFARDMLKRMN